METFGLVVGPSSLPTTMFRYDEAEEVGGNSTSYSYFLQKPIHDYMVTILLFTSMLVGCSSLIIHFKILVKDTFHNIFNIQVKRYALSFGIKLLPISMYLTYILR